MSDNQNHTKRSQLSGRRNRHQLGGGSSSQNADLAAQPNTPGSSTSRHGSAAPGLPLPSSGTPQFPQDSGGGGATQPQGSTQSSSFAGGMAHNTTLGPETEIRTVTETIRTIVEPVSVQTTEVRKVVSSRKDTFTSRTQGISDGGPRLDRTETSSTSVEVHGGRDTNHHSPPEIAPSYGTETPLTTPPTASPTGHGILQPVYPDPTPEFQTSSATSHRVSNVGTNDSPRPTLRRAEDKDIHPISWSSPQPTVQFTEADSFIRQHIYKHAGSLTKSKTITGLEVYLEHIAKERLLRMPAPGSDLDRILQAAQFFGLQLSGLGCAIGDTTGVVQSGLVKALTTMQTLLLLGLYHSRTLLPTFQVFYHLSTKISNILHGHGAPQARKGLAKLFGAAVALVDAVAITYQTELKSLVDNSYTTIRFDKEFAPMMNGILEAEQEVLTHMWLLQMGQHKGEHSAQSVQYVSQKLKPIWSNVDTFYERAYGTLDRIGATCQWFEFELDEYLDSDRKSMAIIGAAGTGKTMLAGWIEERLQRSLEHGEYTAFAYGLPSDSREDCTQVAVLKALVLQMFTMGAGDWGVYAKLAEAFQQREHLPDNSLLEVALWDALRCGIVALDSMDKKLVVILDGIDRIVIHERDQHPPFFERLLGVVAESNNCRLITLSRTLPIDVTKETIQFSLPAEDLRNDIEAYLQESLSTLVDPIRPGVDELSSIVASLVQKPNITFSWAHLVVRLLSKSNSPAHLKQTVKDINGTIDNVIKRLITKDDITDEISRKALSLMLVADRPMTVQEVSEFVGFDTESGGHEPFGDLAEHIRDNCSDFVVVWHGSLHFINDQIRSHIGSLMGKSEPIHAEVTKTLLLYAASIMKYKDIRAPTFHLELPQDMEERLSSFHLLQYAITNWHSHHRASRLPVTSLMQVLPRSYRFAILQFALWRTTSPSTLVTDFSFFLDVQKACFKDTTDSPLILQTLAILASMHDNIDDSHYLDAAEFYYLAASYLEPSDGITERIGTFLVECAKAYLLCIERCFKSGQVMDQDTGKVNMRKEKMIWLVINISKGIYGPSSDEVMYWYDQLIRHYVSLGMLDKIHTIIPDDPDEELPQPLVRRIYDYVVEYNVDIERDDDEVPEAAKQTHSDFFEKMHGRLRDQLAKDTVDYHLQMAYIYQGRRKWDQAEGTYVSLWKRTRARFESGPTPAPILLQKDILLVGIKYAQFLQSRNHTIEAAHILTQLWGEHQRYTWSEQEIFTFWRRIGYQLRALGYLDIAVSILTKICETSEDDRDFLEITEITEEITRKNVKTEISTTITILEEVIKRRAQGGKIDGNYFAIVLTISNRYIMLKQWGDAERVLRECLNVSWVEFLSEKAPIQVPDQHAIWCVKVAIRLSQWHHSQGHHDFADGSWRRTLDSCLAILPTSDLDESERLLLALLEFADWRHYYPKIEKSFYDDILVPYRNRKDASTDVVVRALYSLAAYSRDSGFLYYRDIVETLNTGRSSCHPQAIDAALKLIQYFSDQDKWKEMRSTCELLWGTFVSNSGEVTFQELQAQSIFTKYSFILEHHSKGPEDHSLLQRVSEEYRHTSKIVFGPNSDTYVMAMVTFGASCEARQLDVDAAEAYEEIITKTITTTTNKHTITEAKELLSKLHCRLVKNGQSIEITGDCLEQIIAHCEERYSLSMKEHGVWHTETLARLHMIVVLCQKLSGDPSHTLIIQRLETTFKTILTSSCDDLSLYDAAKPLASTFVAAKQQTLAVDLVFGVRHQTIFGTIPRVPNHPQLDLNLTSLHRSSFVFLVCFSQHVTGCAPGMYADLMAASRLEKVLYDKYTAVSQNKASPRHIEDTLESGAKLRAFWVDQEQRRLADLLEDSLFALFQKLYGTVSTVKTKESEARKFFLRLLLSLQERDSRPVNINPDAEFGMLVCQAGNTEVSELIGGEAFESALEVAKFTFEFADGKGFYTDQLRVGYIYGLACLMAGISLDGTDQPLKKPSGALAGQFVALSKRVTTRAMAIFKEIDIDMALLNPRNRDSILRLLGHQQNYAQLQKYLDTLYDSARLQRPGNVALILSLIRLGIRARAGVQGEGKSASLASAIQRCDKFLHNLGEVYGHLGQETLTVREMLSALLSAAGKFPQAERIHTDLLRKVKAEAGRLVKIGAGRAGGRTNFLVATAQKHVVFLMYARVRQNGHKWADTKRVLDRWDFELKRCLGESYASPLAKNAVYQAGGVVPKDDHTGVYSVSLDGEDWKLDDGTEAAAVTDLKGGKLYTGAAESIWGWVICGKHRQDS